jgi:hypothetical protein
MTKNAAKRKVNTNKKTKTNSVPSWRDCPTAIASNVNRAREYKS